MSFFSSVIFSFLQEQGIAIDVSMCHAVFNWETDTHICKSKRCRANLFSIFRSREAEGLTHGGCEETSMPNAILGIAI